MALVTYAAETDFATVTMDDGKLNVLSRSMLSELDAALDRADADDVAAVVLGGRRGVFSAGFDMGVLEGGGPEAYRMLTAGFRLAERLLGSPRPVIAACSGHAVAMGAFLLLSCDYRLGGTAPCRVSANEVAIGLTMPRAAIEICRQRLAPAPFVLAVSLATDFGPQEALTAGFFDRLVTPSEIGPAARSVARTLAGLDRAAYASTKRRVTAPMLAALGEAIDADTAEWEALAGMAASAQP